MSVAMTDETTESEKDSFDNEFDSNNDSTADEENDAALCEASFSHTCACTI